MEGPGCQRIEALGCQSMEGPECQRMKGPECQRMEGLGCQGNGKSLLAKLHLVEDPETGLHRLPPSGSGSRPPSPDSGYSEAGSRPPFTDYLIPDTPLTLPEPEGQDSPGPRLGAVDGAGPEGLMGEEALLGPGGTVSHGRRSEDSRRGLYGVTVIERIDLEAGEGGSSVQLWPLERTREGEQEGAPAPEAEQQSPLLTPGPEASWGASPGTKSWTRKLLLPNVMLSFRVLQKLCAVCALLLLLVVTLAALIGHCLSHDAPDPSRIESCPMDWLHSRNKCYYFSMMYEMEGDWKNSQSFCSSYNGSLALFDTQEELSFLLDVSCQHHMWVGLRKRQDGIHWANGSACSSSLCRITDFGECAYIGDKALRASACHLLRPYICTKRPYV